MDREFPLKSVERRLAAILSADAVGYTRLMADDDEATVRAITSSRALISECVERYGGRVVDATGDNLLAEFPSALDAVHSAIDIQKRIAGRDDGVSPERRMPFRIGLHMGDVMVDGERVYGDGVNIAARLESLANPGGLCLSSTVYEQVRGRLAHEFDDLGLREFKNVPHPVHVFRAQIGPHEADGASSAYELPAIAVLPFDNLSSASDQEFLGDAIAADLIALLSAWRSFPIIARNSSFTYGGRSVDLKQVSRELGARYVVSGSVRAAGNRVRISAEVADATTSQTVWAEKFDRLLEEIFELQDEVTEAIVTALKPALRMAEAERARRQPTEDLEAWALVNRAWTELQRDISNRDVARTARDATERALEIDPEYALGHAVHAFAHSLLIFDSLGPDSGETNEKILASILASIRRATSIAPDDPQLWQVQGAIMGNLGHTRDAIRAHTRSLELDPNNAQALAGLGVALIFDQRSEEGLPHIERAMRLSPRDPLLYSWLAYRGLLCMVLGRFEEAASDAQNSVDRTPSATAWMTLATSLAILGRVEEGRVARIAYEEIASNPSVRILEPQIRLLARSEEEAERLIEAMHKVGFHD